MISANLDQSRRFKLLKEQEQKVLDQQDEEKAKNSYTYYNAHDQRKQEMELKRKQFEEFQQRTAKNYLDNVASPQSDKLTKLYIKQMKDE